MSDALREWELVCRVAADARNIGVVPVKSSAILAINAELDRLRAELAQAMVERGRALTAGDALEQENERLRAQVAALSALDGDALAARVNAMKPGESLDLRWAAPAPAEPVTAAYGQVWRNGKLVMCEQYDREPCPHQPERRCSDCPARATPAAALSAPAPAPAEAVAWQWRRKGEPWSLDKTFNSQVYATTPNSEVRPLYAAPAAPAGWQPIETAPDDMGAYLFRVNGIAVQGFRDAAGIMCVQNERHEWRKMRGKPTHWMPLPAAPGAQGDAS